MAERTETAVARKLLSQIEKVGAFCASANDLLEGLNDLVADMRERVRELLNEPDVPELEFGEQDLSVSWRGGRFQFQKGSDRPYRMLKALYQAGPDGLSHAELAEKVDGDEFSDVKRCARGLAQKLEKYGCPKRLDWNRRLFWLENA